MIAIFGSYGSCVKFWVCLGWQDEAASLLPLRELRAINRSWIEKTTANFRSQMSV